MGHTRTWMTYRRGIIIGILGMGTIDAIARIISSNKDTNHDPQSETNMTSEKAYEW